MQDSQPVHAFALYAQPAICFSRPSACFAFFTGFWSGIFPGKGVLDARTNHQSVFSRLCREQRDGLRDSRGSLLEERRRSANTSSLSAASRIKSEGSGTTIGEEFREKDGEIVHGSSAATPAETGAASSEEAGKREDGEMKEEEGEGEGGGGASITINGEQNSDSSAGDKQFSFLTSGFDDATLGGMRPPPFLLPKVAINDGVVQVISLSPPRLAFSAAGKPIPAQFLASHDGLSVQYPMESSCCMLGVLYGTSDLNHKLKICPSPHCLTRPRLMDAPGDGVRPLGNFGFRAQRCLGVVAYAQHIQPPAATATTIAEQRGGRGGRHRSAPRGRSCG